MSRASASSDVFTAVAEPSRREILSLLAGSERSVSEIVGAVDLSQPSVSKHLKVLQDVGLVSSRREGRNVLYRIEGSAIRPLYEWAETFRRHWRHQLARVKERAERAGPTQGPAEKGDPA